MRVLPMYSLYKSKVQFTYFSGTGTMIVCRLDNGALAPAMNTNCDFLLVFLGLWFCPYLYNSNKPFGPIYLTLLVGVGIKELKREKNPKYW